MKRQEIKKVLNELTADIDSIADKKAVGIIKVLVNLVEILAEENALLREKNQHLMDEINHLKGEKGKPEFRKQKKYDDDESDNNNHSSEEERKIRSDKRDKRPSVREAATSRHDCSLIQHKLRHILFLFLGSFDLLPIS